MSTKPLLSICCITYNHELYIAQAIKGFLMQKTTFDFKIIIGEDCSTDTTREICISYQKKYPDKIKLLLHTKNVGMSKNSLLTKQAAQTKYIALCEGDDYWTDPYKLQKQVDFLEQNQDYTLCAHRYVERNEQSGAEHLSHADVFTDKTPIEVTISNYLKPYIISTNTIVFRNCIDYTRITSKGFKDIFQYALLLDKGNGICLPDIMSVYRLHSGGVWSMKRDIELHKATSQTAYYMALHFYDTHQSISDFAHYTIHGYLQEAYTHRISKKEIISITYRLLRTSWKRFTPWQKKQLIYKALRYVFTKK